MKHLLRNLNPIWVWVLLLESVFDVFKSKRRWLHGKEVTILNWVFLNSTARKQYMVGKRWPNSRNEQTILHTEKEKHGNGLALACKLPMSSASLGWVTMVKTRTNPKPQIGDTFNLTVFWISDRINWILYRKIYHLIQGIVMFCFIFS